MKTTTNIPSSFAQSKHANYDEYPPKNTPKNNTPWVCLPYVTILHQPTVVIRDPSTSTNTTTKADEFESQTNERWLTIVGVMATNVASIGIFGPNWRAIKVVGGTNVVSRSLTKPMQLGKSVYKSLTWLTT